MMKASQVRHFVFIFCLYVFFVVGMAQTYAQDAAVPLNLPDDFVLQTGYFEFPGLTYTDENGNPAGFVNDITIKVLDHAGIPYELKSYPAARLYQNLQEGKLHLFNGVSAIPVVAQSTIASELRLFPIEMRVYWHGDLPEIAEKEDLIGHSVILVRGFTYKDWGAWIRAGDQDIDFFDTNTHESAFGMLQKGRAEYLLNYKYIDFEVLEQVEIPDLVTKPLFLWWCAFNIHKDAPNAEAVLHALEISYQELVKQGALKQYD